jgi:hypothetical protein
MRNLKMNSGKNLRPWTLLALLATLGLPACGKIPKPYRGNFVDSASGAQLTLERNLGMLTTREGKKIESDAKQLTFKELSQGVAGIYVRPDKQDPDVVEVYWLVPRLETRKEEAGFTWMDSEVLYSRMNSNEENPVQHLKMIHCENGLLMLDSQTQSWNGGCPAERVDYDFVRVNY